MNKESVNRQKQTGTGGKFGPLVKSESAISSLPAEDKSTPVSSVVIPPSRPSERELRLFERGEQMEASDGSILTVQIADEGAHYEERFWVDENGLEHNPDGPALVTADGTMQWFRHGFLHREDGPAATYRDGSAYYFKNGRLHRDGGGPAVQSSNGDLLWYRRGEFIRGVNKYGQPVNEYFDRIG